MSLRMSDVSAGAEKVSLGMSESGQSNKNNVPANNISAGTHDGRINADLTNFLDLTSELMRIKEGHLEFLFEYVSI